jgi:hypothetical protein
MARNSWFGHAAVVLSSALTLAGCGASDSGGKGTGDTGIVGGVASAELAADLSFLREEEKLARDVYRTLYDTWQLQPHANIASSEQTHTSQVASALSAFDLPDPVVDDGVGAFENATLGELYVQLVDQGKQSEIASLTVGATIEDLDIRDIEEMKARTGDIGVLGMYESLQCGSRNHMRSFTSQLATRGESYTPQYIDAADYQAIVTGAHEKCGM